MSYAHSSLLLASYDATDCPQPLERRVSSNASSDSWVLDSRVSEELQRYGTSSPEFVTPIDDHFQFQRSISLEDVSWIRSSTESIPEPDVEFNKHTGSGEITGDDITPKHHENVKIPDTCDTHNVYNNSGHEGTNSNSVRYRPLSDNGDTSSGTEGRWRTIPRFAPFSQSQPRPRANGQPIQVKTKIRSMWNNMKYGWRVKKDINLKIDSSICLLGRYYHAKFVDISHEYAASKAITDKLKVTEAKERFKEDLKSRIWFTYRFNFPPIPGTDYTTDSGWGCMLRAGQMMMAQALMCHFLYRDWRLPIISNDYCDKKHRVIIRWFGDFFSPRCPFSIHNLVVLGHKYGRKVGDWYGPTHVAHVLRKALISARRHSSCKFNNICMYVAPDGIIFKQDIVDLCTSSFDLPSPTDIDSPSASVSQGKLFSKDIANAIQNVNCVSTRHSLGGNSIVGWTSETASTLTRNISECKEASESLTSSLEPSLEQVDCDCTFLNTSTPKQEWKSLILFVSVRLGNEKVNRFYIPWLKSLLEYEHCIGIIGGRPKHAVYFIGWQDEKLIHLDPHFCQPSVDVEKEDFCEKSFHCTSVQTMPFVEMDPSCSIGFYFKTKEDFDSFPRKIVEISPFEKNVDYPPFAFVDGRRADAERADILCDASFCVVSNSGKSFSKDEDEYILL